MARSSERNTPDFVKILFNEVVNITSLAHYARVQANDAELRARYCMSLAEKAVCEADSVHQVSESLTCTSKMVANMTLDYICSLCSDKESDSRDVSTDEQVILESLREMGSPEKFKTEYFDKVKDKSDSLKYQTSTQNKVFSTRESAGDEQRRDERKSNLKTSPVNKDESLDSSFGSTGSASAFDNVHSDSSNEHLDRFQEQFPELLIENKEQNSKDLPKEFDSSHSLPILYEDSYQGPRGKKPVSWTEKKNIRKMQRKLREIDLDGNELDHVSVVASGEFPEFVNDNIRCDTRKETLMKSVRFNEDQPSTSENDTIYSRTVEKD